MDPNQISQINGLNNLNQMSIYQNYLMNSDNKVDSQANLNMLYNYQKYYKGSARHGANVNNIPVPNTYLQNTTNQNTSAGLPLSYGNEISNFQENKLESSDLEENIEDSAISSNQILNSEDINERNVQSQHEESEVERPWSKAAKDASIIQKGTELFVGNLSLDTTENDLYETFRDCGEVIDIRVHKNHQNKNCYAFIRMLTKEMLREAMNKNMTVLKGRKIKITKSNENSTIFIGNIRKNWKNSDIEAKVRRIFPNCEKIENFPDPNNPTKNRGFCFVVFKSRNDAIKALNYVNNKGGINIDGVPLTCDWADVIDEDDNSSKQVFISGLNEEVSEDSLKHIFQEFGQIESIILSREHKNSKRKDLAFITYNTHEEAKNALDNFKIKQNTPDDRIKALGERVCISLAFSQQAMQNKKKIKESRRKTTGVIVNAPNLLGKLIGTTHGIDTRQGNLANIPSTSLPNLFNTNISMQLPQTSIGNPQLMGVDLTAINPNNQNTTALLTMMNLLNMNKNNMNINPALFNQMMSACLESMMNQNIPTNQPIVTQAPQGMMPGMQNFNRLNNFNNLNTPSTLNSLKSLNNFNTLPNQVSLSNNSNYPFTQILNLGASKINTKRTKKINQKKSYNSTSFINANNPNSA